MTIYTTTWLSEDSDTYHAQTGELVFGQEGDDFLYYGFVDEDDHDNFTLGQYAFLRGGTGNDFIAGFHGTQANGDDGDDQIHLLNARGAYADGGADNDTIVVHRAPQHSSSLEDWHGVTANGGSGDDIVSFSGISWLDALDGGDGFDHLELFNSDGHISHFSLALGGSTSGAIATGFETLTYHGADNFDAVEGGANTDWIYGFGQTDTISGLGGADFLYGGDGNDIVNGGDGDDAIDGGGGDDLLRGGNGNDYVRGREGNDQISSGAGGGALHGDEGNDTIRTGSGMDRVFAGDGHDRIFEETADFVFINPHNGNSSGGDSISGGLGNDRIDAGAGNDAIAGDEGNDSLIGGAGNDTISGGIGLDTVDWSAATGNIVLDLDSNGNGAPGPVAGIGTDTVSGIENIIAGSGNDSLSGNFEWNTFTGGGGDDALDTGGGMDHLIGGTGRDRMTGGEGRDWFEFDDFDTGVTSATRDHITDFQSGIDIIYLRDIDANTATTGNDAFTFIGTSAFAANTPGTVRFQISGNNTLIEFNTDADAAAEGQIALTGIVNLTGADFFL